MRRRSRASSKLAKARSRKAMPKRRSAPTVRAESESVRLHRERDEALLRETANSEILRLISKSPGDMGLVFRVILENATRICNAKFGVLSLSEGNAQRIVAMHNAPPAYAELRQRDPIMRPTGNLPLWRAVATKRAVQTADAANDPANQDDPNRRKFVAATGVRSFIVVPILKDNEVVGVINVFRQEVRPFTDKQIAVLESFAAQAVIAIENTRLLNELRQRTSDLTASLEQQTATSEVLKVISSSTGKLEPVFDVMLKNANRLCDAKFSALFIYENGVIRVPSHVDLPPRLAEHLRKRNGQPPTPGTAIETLIRTKRLIHIPDQRGSPEGLSSPATTLAGARTYLAVPLLKDGNVIGAIAIYRQEVRPFTDKQIELVQNFAAQAVIAIENARLLNELRQSLEQQTATADVLGVISSSPGELEPVFQAMLE